jgi:hypothetical protein
MFMVYSFIFIFHYFLSPLVCSLLRVCEHISKQNSSKIVCVNVADDDEVMVTTYSPPGYFERFKEGIEDMISGMVCRNVDKESRLIHSAYNLGMFLSVTYHANCQESFL